VTPQAHDSDHLWYQLCCMCGSSPLPAQDKHPFLQQLRERFLVNDQPDAQFFSIYLFQFSACFEQPRAHHQENQMYQYNLWYMSLCVGDRFVCCSESSFGLFVLSFVCSFVLLVSLFFCFSFVCLFICIACLFVCLFFRSFFRFFDRFACLFVCLLVSLFFLLRLCQQPRIYNVITEHEISIIKLYTQLQAKT